MDKTMKQALLLLLVCSGPALLAQAWCPPGATWHYGFASDNFNGFQKYTYTADTVFNGLHYQVIAKEIHTHWQNPPSDQVVHAPDIYMRVVDEVVFGFDPSGNLDTLVWFDAVPGDAWQVLQPDDSGCACYYTVMDTGHVVLDGVSLRYLQTEITSPFFNCEAASRLFVERIGSFGSFLGDVGECGIGVSDTTLRCYQDFQMNYSPENALPCEFILDIGEASVRSVVAVYPNPGTDVIHVGTGNSAPTDVRVLDGMGRVVLRARNAVGLVEFNSSELSAGIYMVELRSPQGRRTIRWVKQ